MTKRGNFTKQVAKGNTHLNLSNGVLLTVTAVYPSLTIRDASNQYPAVNSLALKAHLFY